MISFCAYCSDSLSLARERTIAGLGYFSFSLGALRTLPLSILPIDPTNNSVLSLSPYRGKPFECNPIGALSKPLPSNYPALITEALALLQGVLFALEMQIPSAIFKSDALSVVQALIVEDFGGEVGHILKDINSLSSSFTSCSFKHLKKGKQQSSTCFSKRSQALGRGSDLEGCHSPSNPANSKG
ncbi:hypothetical protein SO802_007551 [Lithocarpus litseifolius]|uniref:RNase H type-1 domain-containing protein n=1 Tax=Lithocarpus litseifolius TaxID=425828 RepID=A0AAW2DSC0_9ROSI